MTIQKLKERALENYLAGDRSFGDFWSDEVENAMDHLLDVATVGDKVDDETLPIIEDPDNQHEVADGMVDIYTKKLIDWYAEDTARLSYADDAPGWEEDTTRKLMAGQYFYNSELVGVAARLLGEVLEKREDEEEGGE